MPSGNNQYQNREINCDFFRVNAGSDGKGDFLQIVKTFYGQCADAGSRNLQTDDGFVRLHDWRTSGSVASGALLRLRTDGSARIGHVSSDTIRDLVLSEGEALADFSCFCYFGEFRTLVIHHNRDAGNHNRLSWYLQQKTKVWPIIFEPMISADALSLFDRMQELTIAEIQIALPDNLGPETEGKDLSVRDEIRLAQRSKAATFKMRFSMGHTRKKLNINFLRPWIKEQLQEHGESVRSALVRGRIEEGEDLRVIDLINDRIRERVPLRTGGQRATFRDFYNAIERAYEGRYNELSKMYTTNVP